MTFSPRHTRCFPALFVGLMWGVVVAMPWCAAGTADLESAKALHEKGVNGDKDAVIECVRILEERLRAQPDDALARVWLGSAYTLRARDLTVGPKKLEMLKLGGATMDQAVKEEPENPSILIVRAMNSYHLPAIFGRKKVAREDFIKLMKMAGSDSSLPKEDRQLVFYYAGLSLKDTGDAAGAKEAWRSGLAIDPDSPTAVKLRKLLK